MAYSALPRGHTLRVSPAVSPREASMSDSTVPANGAETALVEAPPGDFLLQLAMRADVDAAKVSALADTYIKLQEQRRRWDAADRAEAARREYLADKAAMQAALPVLEKDTPNQEGKGKFVDFGDLWAACYPIWTQHGFTVSYDVVPTDNGLIRLKLILEHRGGHRTEYLAPDTPPDTAGPRGTVNKTIPQGNQSTITYLQRGLLTRALGIGMRREDDDGNSGRPASSAVSPGAHPRQTIAEWLHAFAADLANCDWVSEVDTVVARPDVQLAKGRFAGDAKARLEELEAAAYKRVRARERQVMGDA